MRLRYLATGIIVTAVLAAAAFSQSARVMPPAWPYAQRQLAPGVVPLQVAATHPPALTPPGTPDPNAPPPVLLQAEGSKFRFTQEQVGNSYAPADWFPEDHPRMPELVAHGRPGTVRACGLCHLPNGRGRPENAPVHGLSYFYIVQQLQDFRQGLRRSAEPRKANTPEMENIARTMSDDEIREVATYYASISVPQYIRVVETGTVPTTRIQGEIYFPTDDGRTEPLGVRIIETPEDVAQTLLRNPRSGFIAYVPVGSIARGEALATSGGGGRTLPCAVCHGADLRGIGPVPTIAGRSPSYLARQMYDMKIGTRNGPMAALMKPVLANLTDADIVDLVAYASSRKP